MVIKNGSVSLDDKGCHSTAKNLEGKAETTDREHDIFVSF